MLRQPLQGFKIKRLNNKLDKLNKLNKLDKLNKNLLTQKALTS
jgi:hypothetical protein